MPARKSASDTDREERILKTAMYDRRGYSQSDIAKLLGVSQTQVSLDLKLVRSRYTERMIEDKSGLTNEMREHYRDIRREAWIQWERSKLASQKEVTQTIGGADGEEKERVTRTVEGRCGDPAYLQTIIKTLDSERDMLGLNAPKDINIKAQVLNWDMLADPATGGLPFEEPPDLIEQQLRALESATLENRDLEDKDVVLLNDQTVVPVPRTDKTETGHQPPLTFPQEKGDDGTDKESNNELQREAPRRGGDSDRVPDKPKQGRKGGSR